MNERIAKAMREYSAALRAYCRCPDSVPDFNSALSDRVAVTNVTDQSLRLPQTRTPVRGLSDARIDVKEIPRPERQDRATLASVIAQAIP